MAKPVVTKRSCGNCKDRKILCDRGFPACSQCTRGKRVCKGYGMRLSWPRENDTRRAMVLKASHLIGHQKKRVNHTDMVCATNWDIEMYMYLSSLVARPPPLHEPVSWNPHKIGEKEWDLLSYFQSEASRSLTTFYSDPRPLALFLLQISQSSSTLASTAVLHSILGLSSLYRYGWNPQALELKLSSLRALALASETFDETVEGAHHVAAGMLLCSFEVHMASCSASEWTWYVNGIKRVLYSNIPRRKCHLNSQKHELMYWVYYHDVMKQFSMRHWKTALDGQYPVTVAQPQIIDAHTERKEISREDILDCNAPLKTSPWITDLMKLMSDICCAIPRNPLFEERSAQDLVEFKNRIRILDWRLRSVQLPSATDKATATVRFYQLAMLIYLNRVTENILDQASTIQSDIDEAFVILDNLDLCKPHFPMYIVGWEARTDERRASWLALLERTKKDPSSRALFHVRALVKAGWTQDDLAEKDLNYWNKVTTLVSVCYTMPSFV